MCIIVHHIYAVPVETRSGCEILLGQELQMVVSHLCGSLESNPGPLEE